MNTTGLKTAASVKPTAGSVQRKDDAPKEKIKQRDFFRNLGRK
jgi:hypothetical protein